MNTHHAIRLSNKTARHIFLTHHGLAGSAMSTPQSVIDALGFVQVDSISTVARAHHMILHARKTSYRALHLDPLVARDRSSFEGWTHDASIIPTQFYPQWRLKFERDAMRMELNWKKWRREGFQQKLDLVLNQIAINGPCCSADVGLDEPRSKGGWWDWHPSKTALEYLWRSGRLAVTKRENFRKHYDLSENVIPVDKFENHMEDTDIIDWSCHAALDRLGFATHSELAAFWAIISPQEARDWCKAALAKGTIIEIEIEATSTPYRAYCRPHILDQAPSPPTGAVRILSPFDPVLRDRKRAERLFGFDYRIEIFVPAKKRKYGYYVFPVLEGARIIGRIDMKCERDAGLLRVKAFWPESDVKLGSTRLSRLETALHRTARFAGTPKLAFEQGWQRAPRAS